MLGDSQNQICWGYQRIQGSIDFIAYNLSEKKKKLATTLEKVKEKKEE